MKRYYSETEETFMVVGTDREIRSLYSAMLKRGYYATFSFMPNLKEDRMYGLLYPRYCDCLTEGFSVVNADAVVRLLLADYR